MTRRRWIMVGVASVVVLSLGVPLVWWQWLGPDRFEDDLVLGAAPNDTISTGDLADLPEGHDSFPVAVDDEPEPEPIELPPLRISDTTRVYAIFSVGSAGMTRAEANRLRVADVGDRGGDRLTDSILLLITDPPTRHAALLSIPRDLWLSHRGHRINETFVRRGAQAFVDDVSQVSGLPVHHLIQANFSAFADLVDAIGGVAMYVDGPMADLYSALYVPDTGCWRFDGATALAYARSRHTLAPRAGSDRWRTTAQASDRSRMRRQQTMLASAWDQVRGDGFVRRLPDLIELADGLTIDASLGLGDVRDLARAFSDVASGRVEGYVLPTVDRRVGAAQVQSISWSRALPLYERLRNWPPGGTAPGDAAGSEDDAGVEQGTNNEQDAGAEGDSGATSDDASPSGSPDDSANEGAAPSDPEQADEPDDVTAPSATTRPDRGGQPVPTTRSDCTRRSARELPDDPFPYLAAIADGEPVPPYEAPAREDGPSPDPDDEGSASPTDDASEDDDAGTGTDEPSEEEPSEEPSAGPSGPVLIPPP